MQDLTIFVVDDDPDIRDLIVQTLGDEGYRVVDFSDGELAVITARFDRPALMLLDLMMSQVSGWDVVAMLRSSAETANIPVVFVSASRELSVARYDMNVTGHLAKPFELDDLIRTVQMCLSR